MPHQPGNTDVSHQCLTRTWLTNESSGSHTRQCGNVPSFHGKVSSSHTRSPTPSSHACDAVLEALHGLSHCLYHLVPTDNTKIRIIIKLMPSEFVTWKPGWRIVCYTEIADYRSEAYNWIILKSALAVFWVFLLCFNWSTHHFSFTAALVFSSLYSGLPRDLYFFISGWILLFIPPFPINSQMGDHHIQPPSLHYPCPS